MIVGGYSATGPREANEDNYFARSFADVDSISNGVSSFLMVSDGMGGYLGGDVASSLVVKTAQRYLDDLLSIARGNSIEFEPDVALREIVQGAQEAIEAEIAARGNASMGATFVGAFVSPTHAWIGHVGDSRAYLVHMGTVVQLTEDHSQVGRMLSQGIISEREAQSHPARNRIERALGFSDHELDLTEVELAPGDALLLVSDGVYTVLDTTAISRLFAGAGDASATARAIVKEALRRGTDDNSTAVVGLDESVHPTRRIERSRLTRRMATRPAQGTPAPGAPRRDTPTMRIPPVAAAPAPAQPMEDASLERQGLGDTSQTLRALMPFAVLLLAVVLVVVALVVHANGQRVQGQGLAGAPVSSTDVPQATEVEKPGASDIPGEAAQSDLSGPQGSGKDNLTSAPAPAGTSGEQAGPTSAYYTDGTAILRYVDGQGLAWRFTEGPFALSVDPAVAYGSKVEARTTTSDYGRSGYSYRMLDDSYVRDLMGDCDLYAQGARGFSSGLSQLVDDADYLSLVEALANAGGTTARDVVRHLAVLASDTMSAAEWEGVPSSSESAWDDSTSYGDGSQGQRDDESLGSSGYQPSAEEGGHASDDEAITTVPAGQSTHAGPYGTTESLADDPTSTGGNTHER